MQICLIKQDGQTVKEYIKENIDSVMSFVFQLSLVPPYSQHYPPHAPFDTNFHRLAKARDELLQSIIAETAVGLAVVLILQRLWDIVLDANATILAALPTVASISLARNSAI